MAALDKLLKSNELNFALFAVIPSVAILWGLIYYIKNIFIKRAATFNKSFSFKIKGSLRYMFF